MKDIFCFVLCGALAGGLSACGSKTPVSGGAAKHTPPPQSVSAPPSHTVTEPPPRFAFGNYFDVRDRASYRELLESCRRCGTKRLHADGSFERIYPLWGDSPKQCDNWLYKGYMQIEFMENRLPGEAVIRILPGYAGRDASITKWGEPFQVSAVARPINSNDGFQIAVRPSDGLGGGGSLIIRSDYSNHVKQDDPLRVSVTYGTQSGNSAQSFSTDLEKIGKRAINQVSFGCDTYTN